MSISYGSKTKFGKIMLSKSVMYVWLSDEIFMVLSRSGNNIALPFRPRAISPSTLEPNTAGTLGALYAEILTLPCLAGDSNVFRTWSYGRPMTSTRNANAVPESAPGTNPG